MPTKLISSKNIITELSNMEASQHKQDLISTVEGCYQLSQQMLDQGQLSKSLYYLDLAIEMDNGNTPQLITFRAKLYILQKNYKDALDDIQYLLELDAENEDALTAKKILQIKINQQKLLTSFPIYQ